MINWTCTIDVNVGIEMIIGAHIASGTICMTIIRASRVNITLHATALVWKNKIKHLENILTHGLNDYADVVLTLL